MDKELIESVSQSSFWSQLMILLGFITLIIKGLKYLITAEVKTAIDEAMTVIREDNLLTNQKIDKLIEILIKK